MHGPTTTRADWGVPLALLALNLVPVGASVARVVFIAQGETGADHDRFLAAPAVTLVHVIAASLYAFLGAFQFSPGLRRRWPRWHRLGGRVLLVSGLVGASAGLWMTLGLDVPSKFQGPLLVGVRLAVGLGWVASLGLGWRSILQRDVAGHEAWMIRAYALGGGAGTQALIFLPWMAVAGVPEGLPHDVAMLAGWVINLVVAERLIRRARSVAEPALPAAA